MKYLYAYECESEGFSKPSDLQTAIENNKRERRPSELEKIPGHLIIHSPEMAIMRTAEIGSVRSPLVSSAPIQVVASPTTISLPCGTVPSYPGGIILAAPGKPPMALTQQMGSPQLVHVAGSVNSTVPLMVPTAMAAPQQPAVTKVTSPSIMNHTVAPAVTHIPVAPSNTAHPVVTNHNGTGDNETQPPSPKRAALDKEMESFSLPSMHINLTPGMYISIVSDFNKNDSNMINCD